MSHKDSYEHTSTKPLDQPIQPAEELSSTAAPKLADLEGSIHPDKQSQIHEEDALDEEEAEKTYRRGLAFYHGHGVQKDVLRAIQLFKRAEKKGHIGAQNSLTYCYMNDDAHKNIPAAIRRYKILADQGDMLAQNNLATAYFHGVGIEKNEIEAIRLYQLSADQGHAVAQTNLAACYLNGIGMPKDAAGAIRLLKLASDQGYARAQNKLGALYWCGTGVKKNKFRAEALFVLAVDQGDPIAQQNLFTLVANKKTVSIVPIKKSTTSTKKTNQNQKELARLLKGAKKTDTKKGATAQFKMANLSAQNGINEKAIELYHLAARTFDALKIPSKATSAYESAALLGDAETQYKLAMRYRERDEPITKETTNQFLMLLTAPEEQQEAKLFRLENTQGMAALLFRIAAHQGHSESLCELAFCYIRDLSRNRDDETVIDLFTLAAYRESERAQIELSDHHKRQALDISKSEDNRERHRQEALRWSKKMPEQSHQKTLETKKSNNEHIVTTIEIEKSDEKIIETAQSKSIKTPKELELEAAQQAKKQAEKEKKSHQLAEQHSKRMAAKRAAQKEKKKQKKLAREQEQAAESKELEAAKKQALEMAAAEKQKSEEAEKQRAQIEKEEREQVIIVHQGNLNPTPSQAPSDMQKSSKEEIEDFSPPLFHEPHDQAPHKVAISDGNPMADNPQPCSVLNHISNPFVHEHVSLIADSKNIPPVTVVPKNNENQPPIVNDEKSIKEIPPALAAEAPQVEPQQMEDYEGLSFHEKAAKIAEEKYREWTSNAQAEQEKAEQALEPSVQQFHQEEAEKAAKKAEMYRELFVLQRYEASKEGSYPKLRMQIAIEYQRVIASSPHPILERCSCLITAKCQCPTILHHPKLDDSVVQLSQHGIPVEEKFDYSDCDQQYLYQPNFPVQQQQNLYAHPYDGQPQWLPHYQWQQHPTNAPEYPCHQHAGPTQERRNPRLLSVQHYGDQGFLGKKTHSHSAGSANVRGSPKGGTQNTTSSHSKF